jgi:hypothetical protein
MTQLLLAAAVLASGVGPLPAPGLPRAKAGGLELSSCAACRDGDKVRVSHTVKWGQGDLQSWFRGDQKEVVLEYCFRAADGAHLATRRPWEVVLLFGHYRAWGCSEEVVLEVPPGAASVEVRAPACGLSSGLLALPTAGRR